MAWFDPRRVRSGGGARVERGGGVPAGPVRARERARAGARARPAGGRRPRRRPAAGARRARQRQDDHARRGGGGRVAAGADPESLLLLTFSRRAATELRERITARLARTTREPLARTFHSYAFGLLRAQAVARGERGPRLLSGPEQDLVVRELLGGEVELGTGTWPEALQPALLTRGFAQELRDLLLRAVERGVGPSRLANWGRDRGRDDWVAAAHFFDEYLDVTALSAGDGPEAYDPAELIRAALDALSTDPELLARERARRRQVFVDEYQDVDPAQEELLRMLAAGADELVAVGDPDQSIYAFRGSDP